MKVDVIDSVAVVRMEEAGANAMDSEFFAALNAAMDEAEQGPARAMVITGRDRFFSAGLALPTVISLSRDGLLQFIDEFSSTMRRVFTLPMPVVAAVNGHAIAGGCILALQCDERVMVDGTAASAKIGLNEVQLGLGLPAFVIESVRLRVPPTHWRRIMRTGSLMSPAEAREAELIDELAPPDQVEARAMERAIELGALPPQAYAQIKAGLRQPIVQAVAAREKADTEAWLDTFYSDEAQRLLHAAVDKLSG